MPEKRQLAPQDTYSDGNLPDKNLREEREKTAFASLEQRLNFAMFLEGRIMQTDNLEKFETQVEEWWREALELFPADVREDFERYAVIEDERKDIQEIFISQLDEEREDDQDDLDEPDPLDARHEILWGAANAIAERNRSVEFLYAMLKAKRMLQRKNSVIKTISREPDLLYSVIKESTKRKINRKKIKEVRLQPTSIIVILESQHYSSHFGNSLGVHIPGTPFCFIRAGEPAIEDTISHEQVHNLTDGAVKCANPMFMFQDRLSMATPLGSSYFEQHIGKKLFRSDAFMDLLHGELIASYEHAEIIEEINADEFLKRRCFSTAELYYEELLREIRRVAQTDANLKKLLTEFHEELKNKFAHVRDAENISLFGWTSTG